MSSDLNRKSVSAVKWAAAGTLIKFLLQLLTQVLLARLLGPESYGLFAMGLVVLTLSTFVADFGFSWSLVQNQDMTEKDVRFAFTWQLISGLAATILLYVFAPAVAAYFREPRVEEVVRWLSLTCLLTAVTAPGTNLLRRQLNFRVLNIIQIASYVIGYLCVGVTMALLGAGVWALVSAWLSQAGSLLLLTYLRAPHSVRPLLWYAGARRSTSAGTVVFVTNLCNWFLNNIDRLFLGRFLNAHAVGVYTVGYNLANTPNSLFLTALQPAFLAAGTKLQDEPERLREAYLSVLSCVWLLIGPAFVLLACASSYLIAFLYGARWVESAPILAVLALAMPAYVSWGMSTPVLWNSGGRHLESLLQLPILAAAGAALWLYAAQGALAVAIIAAATLVTRALVIGFCACRRVHVSFGAIAPLAWRSVVLMGLCAVGTLGAAGLAPVGAPALLKLVLAVAGGVLLPGCAVLAVPQLLGARVIDVLQRFSPPVPVRLHAYLRTRCSIR
ncbi:lipopolysaccharide biosynthesis protein [Massilia sp. YMA4]|uniref:Lipopolysaccharide biosynthesis protein n=1 Tax=[Empedobacter] haloabium TaxID=592317 RepID=A0ABZ1UR85_9BURK|nr:lipopolysaccharide biosynthesis protein [Massilia sp. YMA4]AXA91849.1 lipopolysaccharide biosynthesis protein [Massilia sp. YMA4]